MGSICLETLGLLHPQHPVPPKPASAFHRTVSSPLLGFSVPVQSRWCSAHCAQCLDRAALLLEVVGGPGFPFLLSAEAECYLQSTAVLRVVSGLIWEPDSF